MSIQDVYLDLHVLRLFFENAQGEVYPLDVRSNGINGVAPVTPAPEKEQLNEAATEALKNWLANETRPFWERLWDILRKVVTVLLILLAVVLILRIISWVIMMKRMKRLNTGQDHPKPKRERRRRRRSDRRYDRRYSRRWRR